MRAVKSFPETLPFAHFVFRYFICPYVLYVFTVSVTCHIVLMMSLDTSGTCSVRSFPRFSHHYIAQILERRRHLAPVLRTRCGRHCVNVPKYRAATTSVIDAIHNKTSAAMSAPTCASHNIHKCKVPFFFLNDRRAPRYCARFGV